MLNIKRRSDWTFDTSAGGGVGLGLLGLERGAFYLTPPRHQGEVQCFNYEAIGLCAGFGVKTFNKIPLIGKAPVLQLPFSRTLALTGNGAPAAAPSRGVVVVTRNCKTNDLVRNDFLGLCVFAEIFAGFVAGGSVYAFYFGIPAYKLPIAGASAFVGALPAGLLYSAKGLLLMGGFNFGLQSGFVASGFLGSVFLEKPYSPGLIADPSTGSQGTSGVGPSPSRNTGGGGAGGY